MHIILESGRPISGPGWPNALICSQIPERPAYLEVYLDSNQLFYRPVSAGMEGIGAILWDNMK
jgi:hypothetical protein